MSISKARYSINCIDSSKHGMPRIFSTASSNLSPFPHRINNDVMMSKLHSSECQQGKDARELWFSSGCRVVVTHFIKRRNISLKIRTLTPLRRCLGRM